MSRVLRLSVSAVLLSWIAWKTNWRELGQAFAQLRVDLWLAAVGLFALCQVVSAVRWRRIAAAMAFQRSPAQFVSLYFIGSFFNLLLPTSVGGDVVRALYLNNGSGRRLASFLTVFLDRLSGLMVLLAMACLAVVLSPVALEQWIPWSIWAITGSAAVAVLVLPLLARWFGPRLGELRVQQIKTALGPARQPGLLLETSFWSGLVQAGNVLVVWLVGQAVGVEIPVSFYWIMVPLVSLLTMLPISVNGMGVREQSTVLLLAPFGVPQPTALTLALLCFAAYAANSVLGGVIYLAGRLPRPGTEPQETSDGSFDHHPDQRRARQPRQAA